METPTLDFDSHMRVAQEQHQVGQYQAANEHWVEAQRLAPDELDRARAVRGEASSTFRGGDIRTGMARAEEAVNEHWKLYEPQRDRWFDQDVRVIREVPESIRVLGRMQVLNAIADERQTGTPSQALYFDAKTTFELGDEAAQLLHEIGYGEPDQHEINWWPTRAMVEALAPTGDRKRAQHMARSAWRMAKLAEREEAPTSAHISPAHAKRAHRVALARAVAAQVVSRLATPQPSKRRSAALWLASREKLI